MEGVWGSNPHSSTISADLLGDIREGLAELSTDPAQVLSKDEALRLVRGR